MRFWFRYLVQIVVLAAYFSAAADDSVSFFRAVNVDDDRTVKALLAGGFDPNSRSPQGQVGLFLAMRDDAPKVAAALLDHPRIQIDATSPADETPLMMAALRGNGEWARRLIDRGALLQRKGWTPLHYAASGPDLAVVKLLLGRGAAIDAVSPNGTTPLMMAARYGAQEAADWLLAQGANARLRNDKSLNAADFARAADRQALADKLDAAAR